jgi:hypothetical protein
MKTVFCFLLRTYISRNVGMIDIPVVKVYVHLLYVYIYIYMYVYINMYVDSYTNIYKNIHIYEHICLSKYICKHIYIEKISICISI